MQAPTSSPWDRIARERAFGDGNVIATLRRYSLGSSYHTHYLHRRSIDYYPTCGINVSTTAIRYWRRSTKRVDSTAQRTRTRRVIAYVKPLFAMRALLLTPCRCTLGARALLFFSATFSTATTGSSSGDTPMTECVGGLGRFDEAWLDGVTLGPKLHLDSQFAGMRSPSFLMGGHLAWI